MKAHIHINAKQRQEIDRMGREAAWKEKNDIATRAQYQWGLAMLQAGLSPRTVKRVMDLLPMVGERYAEYQAQQLGDAFMQAMLGDAGVDMPETEHPI